MFISILAVLINNITPFLGVRRGPKVEIISKTAHKQPKIERGLIVINNSDIILKCA